MATEDRKNILIVEDEVKLVKALENQFVKDGFGVSVAFDGDEALEFCKYKTPDFILLDLLLPKINGIEFLKKIKEKQFLKNVPVLILTNLTDDKSMMETRSLGVVGYLIKSNASLSDIVSIVKKYFDKNK